MSCLIRRHTGYLGCAALGAALLGGCASNSLGAAQQQPTLSVAHPITALVPAGFASEDALFAQPFIDIQEWRDAPVRHFYVHGGFEGTDTRFSYYFPPAADYGGRFFQHVTPVPGGENLAQEMPAGPFNKIGFSLSSGAYFVESNGGGTIDLAQGSQALADPTITAWRANAAAAQFSRHVAQQLFPGTARPFGYIYGGSGGAYRTIGGLEMGGSTWDGGVPYVNGSTMAIPNMFTVRMQALRVLRDKFPQIVDAVEPGGSGDPYAGLSEYEGSVLREADLMGFPMPSWFGYRTMGLHGFAALYGGVTTADGAYLADFWAKPGYLGHDRPELFADARIRHESRVTGLVSAGEAIRLGIAAGSSAPTTEDRGGVDNAFRLQPGTDNTQIVGVRLAEAPPAVYFLGGELNVLGGALAGQRLFLDRIVGDVVMFGVTSPAQLAQLAVGDDVRVDNSNFLAMETYHRHQVPGADFPTWDQFRRGDGTPAYPQRPFLVGPLFTQSTAGSTLTGEVNGKVILVSSLWDREAMPWQADWYRQRVEAARGTDTVRLYYTDHALHGDEPGLADVSRTVSYQGVLQQALRDLAAWVEHGTSPPASTQYRIEQGQVIVPDTAEERAGLQPVVTLAANGAERAEVRVGEAVFLSGSITAPPGAGQIVAAEWDFEGVGDFAQNAPVAPGRSSVSLSTSYRFTRPGTYFVGLRGTSQREGDAATPFARIANLGRVRVVVSE